MSDAIAQIVSNFMSRTQDVGAVAIISLDGRLIYSTGNWQIDAQAFLNSINNKEPSIVVQGVKYSTLTATDDSFVATNVTQGLGHIIGAAIDKKGWIVTYVGPNGDKNAILKELFAASAQLISLI
ncbi:MAG: hypothetical protein ACP6IU_07060 [Candidatus Asgardarchaeia archaeon]